MLHKMITLKISLVAFLLVLCGILISCSKKATDTSIALTSLVGTWDKKDSVRITIGADGKFTAQRWVAADTSYANNYALEGTVVINGNDINITATNANLSHLWSAQKITSVTATATLSANNSTINFTNVKILPADLDVAAAVLARLSNAFIKNETPSIKYPMETLSFESIATFQPTDLPTLPTTWTYTNGVFTFDYTNFEYGGTTSDATTSGLALSPAGQHVHLIVDGAPYIALPMAGVDMTNKKVTYSLNLTDGDHTIVAFPSRSYHEAFKNTDAIVMAKITVAGNSQTARTPFKADPAADSIYASRPIRNYSLATKQHEKIVIDFMISNNVKSKLASNAYAVKATINETPFLIREWKPIVFKGLSSKGNYSVTLDLYDYANKKTIKSIKQNFAIID